MGEIVDAVPGTGAAPELGAVPDQIAGRTGRELSGAAGRGPAAPSEHGSSAVDARTPPTAGRGIARDSFEPAYSQLAGILRQRIADGEFRAGDRLPTEAELIRAYGLSPMTVRRAVKILLDEHAVSTVPGRGTFVEAANIAAATFDLGSFHALLADPDVKVKILAVRMVSAGGRVAETLDVPVGTRVVMIRRLLLKDDEPILYHRQWLIYDPRRPVVETEFGVTALRDLFEGRGHTGPKRGRLTLQASVLRGDEARHFRADVGHPAFILEHLFFGFDDRPLSWGLFVCRAEALRFEVTVGFDAALQTPRASLPDVVKGGRP
jgi:GntR family transcriptional regulator